MYKIEFKSRWDIFKLNPSTLPEGQILAQGEDNWFLTSKEYLISHKELSEDIEHQLLFGSSKKV
jgi:hypothetical protein